MSVRAESCFYHAPKLVGGQGLSLSGRISCCGSELPTPKVETGLRERVSSRIKVPAIVLNTFFRAQRNLNLLVYSSKNQEVVDSDEQRHTPRIKVFMG